MYTVTTHKALRDKYLELAKAYNDAEAGSIEEQVAEAKALGFKLAVRTLGHDWGTTLMDADAAAMEQFGEVAMCGGFLIK